MLAKFNQAKSLGIKNYPYIIILTLFYLTLMILSMSFTLLGDNLLLKCLLVLPYTIILLFINLIGFYLYLSNKLMESIAPDFINYDHDPIQPDNKNKNFNFDIHQ